MTLKSVLKNYPSAYNWAQRLYPYFSLMIGTLRLRRGWQEHMLSTWSMFRKSPVVKGRPMNITVEPTNFCNLLCPICETGAGILGREADHMTLEQFKTIFEKVGPHTNTLMFYFMGEPFLNPESYEMIRHAKDIGIPFVTTCTNGDPVNPEKLIESGLDEVNFQIGGMTQETHQIYRVNSNLDRVLTVLKETIRLKRVKNSKIRILCGFIVMKHNEHEVEVFKKRMKELDIDDISIIDACVRNTEQAAKFLPNDKKYWAYDVDALAEGVLRPKLKPKNKCDWINYSLSIHVNGDVVPCCRDPKGEEIMGNLLTEDLEEIWNGDRYMAFRQKIYKGQDQINICKLCSSYPVSKIQ